MQKLGKKELIVEFKQSQSSIPDTLADYNVALDESGLILTYTYDTTADATGITRLLQLLSEAGMSLKDVSTRQSSLEDIFVDLVNQDHEQQLEVQQA